MYIGYSLTRYIYKSGEIGERRGIKYSGGFCCNGIISVLTLRLIVSALGWSLIKMCVKLIYYNCNTVYITV